MKKKSIIWLIWRINPNLSESSAYIFIVSYEKWDDNSVLTLGKTVHFYTKEQLFSIIIGMTIGSFFHSGENVVINLIERFPLHRTAVISIFRPSFIWGFSAMTWPLWLTPRECRKLDISFTFVKRQPVYYSESKSFWHCLHYKFFDEFVNKNKKKL